MGHLDFVEASPEDWSAPPFQLTEKDGWFYGRGTIDMKNGDAALIEALIRLKREGFVPERELVCAFTADEEAGGHGSLAGPDNAIYRLAVGLSRLESYRFPVALTAAMPDLAPAERLSRSV